MCNCDNVGCVLQENDVGIVRKQTKPYTCVFIGCELNRGEEMKVQVKEKLNLLILETAQKCPHGLLDRELNFHQQIRYTLIGKKFLVYHQECVFEEISTHQ